MMMMAQNMRPNHSMAMRCKTDADFGEKVYMLWYEWIYSHSEATNGEMKCIKEEKNK